MATQVPPGYNPETSLLQGGTAPILPVQGGGGFVGPPTPDYNPSASLLSGGTGVIEAVKGGGKAGVSFATDLEEERTFNSTAPPANVSRASRVYTVEIYGIRTEALNLQLDPNLALRQQRLRQYVSREKATRQLTSVTSLASEEGQFVYSNYPKYGDCKPSLPINYFSAMSRKVQFLDDKAHTIWIIPNLRGNKELFETFLEMFVDKGKLPEPDHIFLFTGTFYPDVPNETSVFLFDEILKLKQANPGQIFVLSPPTALLLRNGCYILENTYAMKSTLQKQQGKDKEVPTFFEPDVLVFPHEQIIVRSTDLPISSDSRVSVGLLLKKRVKSKAYYIKPEPGRKTEPAPFGNFTTILSNPSQSETRTWPPKSKQTIRCPKDLDCQLFEAGFPLSQLGDSPLLNLLDTKIYLFHIAHGKNPYLARPKEDGAGDEEEEEEEEEKEPDQPETHEESEEELELEPGAPQVKLQKPTLPKGPFKASAEAVSSPNTVPISVEGFQFELRVPKGKGVRDNWMQGIYTEGEANLLNALQLTPQLLTTIFPEGYKWRISNFFESLVLSNCFKETDLLLKSECADARRFLRKVGFALQRDCLTKASKEWEKAPEGSFDTNEEPGSGSAPTELSEAESPPYTSPDPSLLPPPNNFQEPLNEGENEDGGEGEGEAVPVVGITANDTTDLDALSHALRSLSLPETPAEPSPQDLLARLTALSLALSSLSPSPPSTPPPTRPPPSPEELRARLDALRLGMPAVPQPPKGGKRGSRKQKKQ